MVPGLHEISGIGEYTTKKEKTRTIYYIQDKAFLVENKNTIEIRCDQNLSQALQEKYESVMRSRYFGKGGIEIVPSSQLTKSELEDLIRLSYNITFSRFS